MVSRSVCVCQIGSYFGSVLQTLDVDGDSYTDLLLVGAPMFMGSERDEQGQVYVYKLNTVLREREREGKFSELCFFLLFLRKITKRQCLFFSKCFISEFYFVFLLSQGVT